MSNKERPFDPMNEPEECRMCNNFPDWLEVADEVYQCLNCFSVYDKNGKCVEEHKPEEQEDELYDE